MWVVKMLGASNRDASGVLRVQPSNEKYFGEKLRKEAPPETDEFSLVRTQDLSMQLYGRETAQFVFTQVCELPPELPYILVDGHFLNGFLTKRCENR